MSDQPRQPELALETPDSESATRENSSNHNQALVQSSAGDERFSRSFLAEKLGLPLKKLTDIMIDAGWIRREDNQWQLTAKGEFEGGQYRQSQKFGQYIVWPARVLDHAALKDEGHRLLSATVIGRQYAIPGRLINRLLGDLGWLQAYAKGWHATELGLALGAKQQEDKETGVPYVLWDKQILSNKELKRAIEYCLVETVSCKTLDGRDNLVCHHGLIGNWLYLLSIAYAYQKPVSQTQFSADFYIPEYHLYIDYWGEGLDPTDLKLQFDKREHYQRAKLSVIEINGHTLADIDRELTKAMLKMGVDVY